MERKIYSLKKCKFCNRIAEKLGILEGYKEPLVEMKIHSFKRYFGGSLEEAGR